jgi:hypothetical protein
MNMHVNVGEFTVQALGKERGLLARLVLALRAIFSVPAMQKGSWADGGGRGL